MLTVESLRAGYQSREVVHGISFHIRAGGVAVLLGANGAGKSTTLNALMGKVRTFSGRVRLEGQDVLHAPTDRHVKMGMALVPEGGRVFRDMTVLENLNLGAYTVSQPSLRRQRLEEVMQVFPDLQHRYRQAARTLSGGQRQMLAIGRALMAGPKLLMLDEPFLGLAPQLVEAVIAALGRINREQGVTLLVVEQNVQVLPLADQAYVMRLGEIEISEDEPTRLLHDGRLEASFIG